jgi:hypothetical protein
MIFYGSSTFIMYKNDQAGGRSAATPLNLGLAALVPPGEGLLRQVLVAWRSLSLARIPITKVKEAFLFFEGGIRRY